MSKNLKSGVYFIYNPSNNLVKIGCSNNIKRRFKDIQSGFKHLGYDVELKLIKSIHCEDYFGLESYLHSLFKNHKVINEWYSITIEQVESLEVNIDKYKKKIDLLKGKQPCYKYINGEYKLFGYYNQQKTIEDILYLGNNEKIVYYTLRDLTCCDNKVFVNGDIPTTKELEGIMELSEKSVISALQSLESKNIITRVRKDRKKLIIINPEYYVYGKNVDESILSLFK